MSNQDDELDKILDELSFSGINDVSYCPGGHKLEQYARDQAKAAILDWHNQQLERAVIEAKQVSIGDAHEILMAYGKVCEDEGCLSERATGIRMDVATYYSDEQLKSIAQLSKPKEHSS